MSKEQCVEEGLPGPRSYVDLPNAVTDFRVRRVTVSGRRATAVVSFGALTATQRLVKGADGWKIDYFELPVNE